MEQDVEALYSSAVALVAQTMDGSCEWLQRSLGIDWSLARRLHARLVAEAAYLQCRHASIRPPLPGRRCVRLLGVGRAGNIALQQLHSDTPSETLTGFGLDADGRLYLADEYGHHIGHVPLSDGRSQRIALFEALSRSTRIVMIVADSRESDAATLLPLLVQGAKQAGAWVVWLDCRRTVGDEDAALAAMTADADLVFTASSFGVPGIDAAQINVLATHRVLGMLLREFDRDGTGARAA